MKSNDEFIVGRKYQTKHGGEGLCVGFTSEGPPILQFSESCIRIVTDINRWEEVRKAREFWIVLGSPVLVFNTDVEAVDYVDLMDYPYSHIIKVREVV